MVRDVPISGPPTILTVRIFKSDHEAEVQPAFRDALRDGGRYLLTSQRTSPADSQPRDFLKCEPTALAAGVQEPTLSRRVPCFIESSVERRLAPLSLPKFLFQPRSGDSNVRANCCRRFSASDRCTNSVCRLTPAATCFRRFATKKTWVKTKLAPSAQNIEMPPFQNTFPDRRPSDRRDS